MKTALILIFCASTLVYSQIQKAVEISGNTNNYRIHNGQLQERTTTGTENINFELNRYPDIIHHDNSAGSMIRWSFLDPVAIANRNQTSGNGMYHTVGWGLNTERVSVYSNTNSTPLWEHFTNPNTSINYVEISENSDYIASGSYHNIYIFNRSSSTPIFDYNLETQLPDTGIAGPLDITSNGSFIVASASRSDSSWIIGFDRTSTTPVWRYRVGQTNAGGASIQGIKISGNDSVVIANTYGGFYVFRTFTGELLYNGLINPTSSSGTQFPQGISGNGSIIATINYSGYIRVYQWNGSTYNFMWQHQEPPGTYYNWMTAVDITYDGNYISCGTLNFITSSTYDGKVKLFRSTNSSPLWTFTGAGDEITCVSFSKNGNILAASTWGDLSHTTNDLMVFKLSTGVNVPIYQLSTPGSFFWCSVSNDGSTVITSGKKVHARTFGNGGEVYNIFIDTNDSPLGVPVSKNIPLNYSLKQNYPNPFNPETTIKFEIPEMNFVKLIIYDIRGNEVSEIVNGILQPGEYELTWKPSNYSSGVYFCKLEAGKFSRTMKMTLLK